MEETHPTVLTFAILGNSLNLAYNIPLVYLVWKNRSTKNISGTFVMLRFCGSISWLIYAALILDSWVAASYTVTLIATCIIGYIKILERRKNEKEEEEDTVENTTMEIEI